eukprot:tig00021257_g19757.t1
MLSALRSIAGSLFSVQPPPAVAADGAAEREQSAVEEASSAAAGEALRPSTSLRCGSIVRALDAGAVLVRLDGEESALCLSPPAGQPLEQPPRECILWIRENLRPGVRVCAELLEATAPGAAAGEQPDRIPARLLVGEHRLDLELTLLRRGWARLARPAPNLAALLEAEREARAAGAGMWGDGRLPSELGPLPARVRRVLSPCSFLVDLDLDLGPEHGAGPLARRTDGAEELARRGGRGLVLRLAGVRAAGPEEPGGPEALRAARRLVYAPGAQLQACLVFGAGGLAVYERRERGAFVGSLSAGPPGADVGAALVRGGLASLAAPATASDPRSPAFEELLRAATAAERRPEPPRHVFRSLRWTAVSPEDFCARAKEAPAVVLGFALPPEKGGGPAFLKVEVEWPVAAGELRDPSLPAPAGPPGTEPAPAPPVLVHSRITVALSAGGAGGAGRALGLAPGDAAGRERAAAALAALVDRELPLALQRPSGPFFLADASVPPLADALRAAGLVPVPLSPPSAPAPPPRDPPPLAPALQRFPFKYFSIFPRTAQDMAADFPHFPPPEPEAGAGDPRPPTPLPLAGVPSLRTVDYAADLAPDPPPFLDEGLLREAAAGGYAFVCQPAVLSKLLGRAAWALPTGPVHLPQLAEGYIVPKGKKPEDMEGAGVQAWQKAVSDTWNADFVLSPHDVNGRRVWALSSAAALVDAEREAERAEEAEAEAGGGEGGPEAPLPLPRTLAELAAAGRRRRGGGARRRRGGASGPGPSASSPASSQAAATPCALPPVPPRPFFPLRPAGWQELEGGDRGAWAPEPGLPPHREACSRLVGVTPALAARSQVQAQHEGRELLLVGRLVRGCRKARSLAHLYNKGELAEKRSRGLSHEEMRVEYDAFLAAKATGVLARLCVAGWPAGGALVAYHNAARVHGMHALTAARLAACCLAPGVEPQALFAALAAALEALLQQASGKLGGTGAGAETEAWRGRLEVVRHSGALRLAVYPLGAPLGPDAEPVLRVEREIEWPPPAQPDSNGAH